MDGVESYFICPSSFMDRYAHTHPAPTHASADTYISASTKPAGRINKNNSATAPYRFDGLNIFFTFYLLPMMLVRTLYVMPCEYAGHHWLCKMGGCGVFYDTTYRARMIYGYCNFCCRIFPSISSGRSPPASSPTGAPKISQPHGSRILDPVHQRSDLHILLRSDLVLRYFAQFYVPFDSRSGSGCIIISGAFRLQKV